MHYFAVFLFFSFGIVALTMASEHVSSRLADYRAVLAGAWGVALAWLADFNMWTGWGIANLRYHWVGVTLTGVALAGVALVIYSVARFFFGLTRKVDDQAKELEKTELRKVA